MQTRNARRPPEFVMRNEHDALLSSRMALLGLDFGAIQSSGSATLDEIKWRCKSCSFRESCTVDLKRGPNSPVWETYCPSAPALIELAEVFWPTH